MSRAPVTAAPADWGWASFAMPKSRIFTCPLGVTKMFSGLRSRWTMPLSCAAASPARNLRGVLDRLADGQAAGRRAAELVAERLAFEQLRHEVVEAVVLADVVHGEDVRMVERGRRTRLLLEPQQTVAIAAELNRQDLDRDVTSQPDVAAPIHLAHASGAEDAENLVRTETGAGAERHGRETGRIIRLH